VVQRPELAALVGYSDEVLERERRLLIQRVAGLEERVQLHRSVLQQLEVELSAEQSLLREIEELTDRRPQLRLERLDRELRGQRLREVAIEVLQRKAHDGPIHYREWFSLVRAAGWEVRGRNPLNTFLTEIGRADGVERVGQRSGLYQLTPN
jgi:vacuolar-type H+-ATPase subunit I/STV1